MSFFAELKRRRVFRVAAAYIIAAFVIMQGADAILGNIGVSEWVFKALLIFLAVGFIIALVASWFLKVTAEGIVFDYLLPQKASGEVSRQSANSGARSSDGQPSIVVLPFINSSDDPANEYFSDGLTEEIIADLSGVKALSVISRSSSMLLKGTDKNLRTIGQELAVDFVLEGSVRKAGSSLRITAELVDALNDAQLWSEKYSGTIEEVFEVQERVSREIVRALDVTLTADENRRLAEHPIANARAFELYLQARNDLRHWAGEAVGRVPQSLAQAIEIEGETPPLLALKAWSMVSSVKAGVSRDLQPLDEAEKIALQLMASSPEQPYAYAILGFVYYERGQLPEASRYLRRAIEISPNDPDVLFNLGATYIASGYGEGAAAMGRRMVAYDPLAPISWVIAGAAPWFVNGGFEEGLPELMRALELDPKSYISHWHVGYACAASGQLDEAAEHASFLKMVEPEMPYTIQLLALIDALEGRSQEAIDRISTVDLMPLDGHTTFHLAEPLAVAGAADHALDIIEDVVEHGFYPYRFLSQYCPFLDSLRSMPRFDGILSKSKERRDVFMEAENAAL